MMCGGATSYDRGESLFEFILSTNLYVANVEEEYKYVGPHFVKHTRLNTFNGTKYSGIRMESS